MRYENPLLVMSTLGHVSSLLLAPELHTVPIPARVALALLPAVLLYGTFRLDGRLPERLAQVLSTSGCVLQLALTLLAFGLIGLRAFAGEGAASVVASLVGKLVVLGPASFFCAHALWSEYGPQEPVDEKLPPT